MLIKILFININNINYSPVHKREIVNIRTSYVNLIELHVKVQKSTLLNFITLQTGSVRSI